MRSTRLSARILVVDDLEANRRLARSEADGGLLRRADGLSAAKKPCNWPSAKSPDLILLDVMMPGGIDGYEACRRLKAMPETRHIPVVILTTLDDRENKACAACKPAQKSF